MGGVAGRGMGVKLLRDGNGFITNEFTPLHLLRDVKTFHAGGGRLGALVAERKRRRSRRHALIVHLRLVVNFKFLI